MKTLSESNAQPRLVKVQEVCSSRYEPGKKPLSWDERSEGVEVIRTREGEEIKIYSLGGQSSPAVGWEILLTGTVPGSSGGAVAYTWTLYGIAKGGADLQS